MSTADDSNIHRYLDEAFAGIAVTPELQDLKEEIRANLAARVGELIEGGMDAVTAASRAIDELGDIRELVDEIDDGTSSGPRDNTDATAGTPGTPAGTPGTLVGPGRARGTSGTPAASTAAAWAAAHQFNRVRPKPGFVVRTVLLSLLVVAAATLVVLGALHMIDWPLAALLVVAMVGAALAGGVIVADSLLQETSANYPLPARRAILYGVASTCALAGLALVALYLGDDNLTALVETGSVLVLASAIGFISLGTTQTNRSKPWIRAAQRQYAIEDRFTQDPVAAARFGIYTVVIWLFAVAAFVVLSIAVGFAWSWLALLVGLAVFMLVLARMLFPTDSRTQKERH